MPDLSKRPERYATAVIALLIAGSYSYSMVGVRIGLGPDSKLTHVQAENDALQKKLREVSAQQAATEARMATVSATTSHSTKNCSAFPNQEAAQAFWAKNKAEYQAWDGNHNGVACEQLKKAKIVTVAGKASPTPVNTVIITKTVAQIVHQNEHAASSEPKAPAQPAAKPVPKPTAPSKAQILASRQHFGLFTETADEYTQTEATLARDTTIHGYFQGWDTDFRPADVNSAWAAGEIPFLTWESRPLSGGSDAIDYGLDNIVAGAFDAYLRKYANAVKANGLPLVMRFDQEMNGNWYRWCEQDKDYTNSKGSFIAAWRHVHDIFEAAGANNLVIWDWSPNRIDNILKYPSIDNYYPGDAYTDWVGMTGYYRPGDRVPTFDGTYLATLNALRKVAPGKPIFLSEVGATATGNQKLGWVTDFFPGLVRNPDVIGFAWFNYAVTSAGVTNDWRIQSSADVTDAFRAGLYATEFGRDRGKKPILVTAVPVLTPTPTPISSASGSSPAGVNAGVTTAPSPSTSPTAPTTASPTAPTTASPTAPATASPTPLTSTAPAPAANTHVDRHSSHRTSRSNG